MISQAISGNKQITNNTFFINQIIEIYDLEKYNYSYIIKNIEHHSDRGKMIDSQYVSNISECLSRCNKTTNCAGVTYYQHPDYFNNCVLTSEFSKNNIGNHPLYKTYYKIKSIPPGEISNINVDDCRKICDRNKNCAGIVYRPADKTCWNVSGFDANQVKDDNYQSYYKSEPTNRENYIGIL